MCASSALTGRLSDAFCLQVPRLRHRCPDPRSRPPPWRWAVFGLGQWVDDGNSLTKAKMEGDTLRASPGSIGFMIHGINGQMLIPLSALILLIISFFAKMPEGRKYAGMVLRRHRRCRWRSASSPTSVPALGFLHGFWALLLFWLAYRTAKQADLVDPRPARHPRRADGQVISRDRVRVLVGVVLTLAIVVPLGWMWWNSLLPSLYSVMDMGYADYGGGARPAGHDMAGMDGMGTRDGARVRRRQRRLAGHPEGPPAPTWSSTSPSGTATVKLRLGEEASRATRSTAPHRARRSRRPSASSSRSTFTTRTSPGGIALHWHGRRRPQRGGRRRRRHAERDQARQGLHLPLGRAARRHLLVPLPPGLARAGGPRPARRHRDPTRGTGARVVVETLALAHLYDSDETVNGAPATRGWSQSRASGCGSVRSTPTTAPQAIWTIVPLPAGRDRRVRRQRADRGHRPGRS